MIIDLLKDLFLETRESPLSFAVQEAHMYAKNAQQAVGKILNSCGLAVSCPRHSRSHACLSNWCCSHEIFGLNASDGREQHNLISLGADACPVHIEEDEVARGQ